jgi:hypothetical protein
MGGCYDRSAYVRINLLVVVRGRPSLGLLALPVHSTGRCISFGAPGHGSTCLRQAGAQRSFDALRCISSPRLCGAQRGTVERGTSGDVPVRALRRPPLALRQPSGLLARGRGVPRSDGAIPCLCVGSMHDVDAPAFEARPRGACAGLCWPIDKGARIRVKRAKPTAERGEQQPMAARGVTERTDADGRARASKTRRTPERTSARSLARQQRVSGVSKAATEGVTAIVPIRSGRPDEQEGMQAVRCKGPTASVGAGFRQRPLQRNGRHRVPERPKTLWRAWGPRQSFSGGGE